MEILQLVDRIKKTIELGESQFREFKSAFEGAPNARRPRDVKSVARDVAESLVAFANADGGELLVGVEDDGTITGHEFSPEQVQKILQAPRTRVHEQTSLSGPVVRHLELGDKWILYFYVDKGTMHIHQTSDGRCLQRKDLENRPVAAQQLQFERSEQISREYDRSFFDEATVADLDLELVRRISHTIQMSAEKCLQYLGLAEFDRGVLRLRRAALLLFASNIARWHPRCQVRVVRVRGNELKPGRDYSVSSDEVAVGNVLELIAKAWDKLRLHLVETKFSTEAIFRESVMYPEDACREALINAIAHRDYSLEGQGIEIYIFDDRMEVRSPGGLLSTIRVDELMKLQGAHESRNAHIAFLGLQASVPRRHPPAYQARRPPFERHPAGGGLGDLG